MPRAEMRHGTVDARQSRGSDSSHHCKKKTFPSNNSYQLVFACIRLFSEYDLFQVNTTAPTLAARWMKNFTDVCVKKEAETKASL